MRPRMFVHLHRPLKAVCTIIAIIIYYDLNNFSCIRRYVTPTDESNATLYTSSPLPHTMIFVIIRFVCVSL